METRTPGEHLFEAYLQTQGLPFEFEKEHVGKSKRPDYTIAWTGQPVILDVKDFDALDTGGSGAFDPYPRIRQKIDEGRDKFKQFKENCCGLVLYNRGNPLVMLQEDHIMLGSMYGDSGFTFPVNLNTGVGDASQLQRAFLSRGKMLRPKQDKPQNTTISAVITLGAISLDNLRLMDMVHEYPDLSHEELWAEAHRQNPEFDTSRETPRVIVWHNAVARIPFPDDLFRGPYDTHFGIVEEDGGMFQRVTYRGSSLPARVKT